MDLAGDVIRTTCACVCACVYIIEDICIYIYIYIYIYIMYCVFIRVYMYVRVSCDGDRSQRSQPANLGRRPKPARPPAGARTAAKL